MTPDLEAAQEEFRNRVWTTADNREIVIRDMTDDHVINIIHHLRQRTWGGCEILFLFMNEARLRNNLPWWNGPIPYKYPDDAPEYCRALEIPERI
jgi:hypothetical protein